MKINNQVANVLGNSIIKENCLYLPEGQLDRKLYLQVNTVLNALHGKWNRKTKAHIFDTSPVDIIEEILITGEYTDQKKEYQFYETPKNLALQMIKLANIEIDETILEPSAGQGAIAQYIEKCDCIELNAENRKYLIERGFNLVGRDFLEFKDKYDIIIANPPFTKQQDITHVERMIELAKHKVISVMSMGVIFRTNKKTIAFRDKINNLGGTFTKLPEKLFATSGTNVNTCLLYIDIKK